MSTGSISGPDDKPGPVLGSGGCDDEESGDGFLVFSVLDVVDFDVVCGCFLMMIDETLYRITGSTKQKIIIRY